MAVSWERPFFIILTMSKNGIFLCGEAWGEKEEEQGLPFVGPTGWILRQMLDQVGIRFDDCYVTNVFNLRPKPSNDVKNLCGTKAEGISGLPALLKGKYALARYASELDRLYAEIRNENPNVIVALGATAAWALLHTTGIKKYRGAATTTHPIVSERCGRAYKVLPTWHPAAVAREWALRPVALSDLDKARTESEFAEVRRPRRDIWIRPTLDDLRIYEEEFILPAHRLSIDIETKGRQITCIGFAPSPSSAIVVPFYSAQEADGNYWRTLEEELMAWSYVKRWSEGARSAVFQNGLFDVNYLWTEMGITVPNAEHDTMLLHHALQPEMEKGLGFLATIYTNESSWKFMRTSATETRKKED